MKAKSANDSPRYRKFVGERNRALEEFHVRTQSEVGDLTNQFLVRVLEIVSLRYERGWSRSMLADLDSSISQAAEAAAVSITIAVGKMRRNVALLAYTSEVEAIARATFQPKEVRMARAAIAQALTAPSPSGGRMIDRVELALSRVKRDVIDAVQTAKLLEEPLDVALTRVRRTFPKPIRYKRPPRVIRKLREADRKPVDQAPLLVGFVDADQWDDMVRDFVSDYVPKYRGPDSIFDVDLPGGETEEWFGWEIEKELTQDFVERVREGQVQAARDNGVRDFIWISVLDQKTDTCCYWRHGLTTEEIRAELKKKSRDDDCTAVVPPAHFNCRCDLAPMLEGMPEETPPDFGDFETWLNS